MPFCYTERQFDNIAVAAPLTHKQIGQCLRSMMCGPNHIWCACGATAGTAAGARPYSKSAPARPTTLPGPRRCGPFCRQRWPGQPSGRPSRPALKPPLRPICRTMMIRPMMRVLGKQGAQGIWASEEALEKHKTTTKRNQRREQNVQRLGTTL